MSDIMRIFDIANAFSDAQHRQHERAQLQRQIYEATEKRCGNCYHWMKSSDCPIDNQRAGFPSCNHYGCGKFTVKPWQLKWQAELQAKLAALDAPQVARAASGPEREDKDRE